MTESAVSSPALRWLAAYARICSVLLMGITLFFLFGLALNSSSAHRGVWAVAPINFSTAVSLGMSGLALRMHQMNTQSMRILAAVLSVIVVAVGLIRLAPLYRWSGTPQVKSIGSMAPGETSNVDLVAVALIALGLLGALTSIRRLPALKELVAITLLSMSIGGVASYAFTSNMSADNLLSAIAIHKAILLVVAASGWMAAEPGQGFLRITTLQSVGGELARKMMVPALLLPVGFTFAFKRVETYFGITESLALTLGATVTGGAIAGMVWWVSVLFDKAERHREDAASLRFAAFRDALTGLFNRRHFDDAIKMHMNGARGQDSTISLLLLDVDHFKSYNDSFGHQEGDGVLRQVGSVLGAALRPADIAARYGGEEFVVILPETDIVAAEKVAKRICRDIREQAWKMRPVSVSVGVATMRTEDTPDTLTARADRALYQAKHLGRNRICLEAEDPFG